MQKLVIQRTRDLVILGLDYDSSVNEEDNDLNLSQNAIQVFAMNNEEAYNKLISETIVLEKALHESRQALKKIKKEFLTSQANQEIIFINK